MVFITNEYKHLLRYLYNFSFNQRIEMITLNNLQGHLPCTLLQPLINLNKGK